jgi:non-specific serine/threonine protein kinase
MIGTTISHYRITAKLGEGGMGSVYRADDLKLERSVALKLLPTELTSDPRARKLLLTEARVASRLNHPNIATIYEVGETDEIPFIAMELITGESLKDVLRRGVMSSTQLLKVARQIAEGLDEAHRAGVLHRDVKPGNIMLDAGERIKILDFGLSVVTEQRRDPGEDTENYMTRTVTKWNTAGTIPYMAPEQLRGDHTDTRADIFSFGVLLYECLTGRLPFPGETAIDVLHAILRQPPVPLRVLISDVSPQWEQLVQGCLTKDPEQRIRSMRDVVNGLPKESARTTRAEKSVAVLYFENLSSTKDDEYLRDGITEDVITDLSKIKELRVFPRSAVLAFRDQVLTAPHIGQQLNALYVLVGSLRRAGNRLRITAQLVETQTGHSVWAERYDRQMEDVFAIQDEIAQNIAKALRVVLSDEEKRDISKVETADVRAYDYYLRGRQFFHQSRRKSLEAARQMFARAIEIDPGYARAHAGVADCHSVLYLHWDASEDNLTQASAASRKALELDPGLAEAHAAHGLAVSLSKRYDEARDEFEAAIRLNPNLFEAHYFYARTCVQQGKLAEGTQLFEQACRIRPEDYQAPLVVAGVYAGLGRQAESEGCYRRGLQAAEKHLQLYPDDARALYLGATALCQMGERGRSLDWIQRALVMDPDEPMVLYNVACVYALMGKTDEALTCLEKAVTRGYAHKQWIEHDSDLNSLRGHPQFQALLARM